MLKVNVFLIGIMVLFLNVSVIYYALRPQTERVGPEPDVDPQKDENSFFDTFGDQSSFESWDEYSPLGERPKPEYKVANGRVNLNYISDGELWDQPMLLTKKTFNADQDTVTIILKDVKVRPDLVLALKYNLGTVGVHIQEHVGDIPVPLSMRHRVSKPKTKWIDIWMFDDEFDRILFAVNSKPSVANIRLRIHRNLLIYTYYFNHENITQITGEVETKFSGPFKLGLYSLLAGESSVGSVKVSTFRGACLKSDLCKCDHPFSGPDCDTIHNSSSIHPDQMVPINISDYYHKQRYRDMNLENLVATDLEQHQNRLSCTSQKSIIMYLPNYVGFWSLLHHLLYVLDWGFRTDRVLIDPRLDRWVMAEDCYGKSYSCYFKELSACSEFQALKRTDQLVHLDGPEQDETRVVKLVDKRSYFQHHLGYHNSWGGWDPDPLIDVIPKRYLKLDPTLTPIWWRAQMLKYLVRPHPEILQKFEKIKKRIGWTYPIISIHVRGTDKIGSEMEPVSVLRYIDKLEIMREWFGVNTVYVATDDPDVLKQVITLGSIKGFKLIYNDREKRFKEGAFQLFSKNVENAAFNATEAAHDAIVNVLLLAHANFFIGTFSSNMSRAAYELLVAYFGQHSLGVSLDIDWTERVC